MPDDSSDDFKAAQSKHADMIRTSRVFSQATGVPLERLRVAMRNAADATAAQAAAPVVDTTPLPLAPYPDPPPSRFETPGFGQTPDAPVVLPNINQQPTGTAATPYEMGENRTTTDPTAANDTWTRAGGPIPSGGGPFDSVVLTNPRYVSNGDGTGTLYTRRVEGDSNGALFAVGAELATPIP